MAVTEAGSGTQTAVIGTEHTLFDTSAAATYQLRVGLENLASGDILELRVKTIVLSGDTVPGGVEYTRRFIGDQPTDDEHTVSVPASTPHAVSGAIRFTLKQISGTGRAFKWSVLKFA